MTFPQLALIGVLVGTLGLFIWGRWRHDVVAALALLASLLLGLVKPDQAFSGFSDPAVITVALVFILSASIRASGILQRLIRYLQPMLERPHLQVLVFVSICTALSAFMNNIGALAILLPVAIYSAEKTGRSPATLLMPLSFGSLLGGLITLIGTPPNLLISNVRQDIAGQPFTMFDFAPVGLAVALAGIVYLVFAWRLIPPDRRGTPSPESRFKVEDYMTEARIGPGSPAIEMSIRELEKLGDDEITVISIIRGQDRKLAPAGWTRLREGDVLVLEADSAVLKRIVEEAKLELVGNKQLDPAHIRSEEVGIVEAVITHSSQLIGRSPAGARLRDYGLNLLAISRQGRQSHARLSRQRFREGDVVVLQGDLEQMPVTLRDLGALPLAERKIDLGRPVQVALPVGAMATAVVLTAAGVLSVAVAFFAAVVVLALFRTMRLSDMYEAVDGSIIVLLAALIPVTGALQSTGLTEVIASGLAHAGASLPAVASLALVMVATMLVTPILNNAATVLLMGPLAAGFAQKLGLSVDPFLMAVAVGASCDFLTPFGHQSNTLVMGPGGYRFGDYARLGAPLSLLVLLVAVPMIVLVWPLTGG
jgi:di/tricarboxylate transporter